MNAPNDKLKKREFVRPVLDFIFGFRNTRGDILDEVWLCSTDQFSFDPQEFYTLVEERLAAHNIPGMNIRRVRFAEGGLLSGQRSYLRLMRERFAIDTCAAPFGSHFFFSCRFVHVPALVRLWHILATFVVFGIVTALLLKPLGVIFSVIAVIALLFAVVGVLRNASAFTDLDALLLNIPVIATIYENWFRMETYYRVDTRTLYKSILPDLIKSVADEITAAKGVRLAPQSASAPVFKDLVR
jgi:hypothetical protein